MIYIIQNTSHLTIIVTNLTYFYSDLLKKSAVKQGLIGCFRGLVVNGEILDIYSYMSVHLSEIIKECKPSCVPNPCQNKAICKELWSTFKCICQNPWAHYGTYCDISMYTLHQIDKCTSNELPFS